MSELEQKQKQEQQIKIRFFTNNISLENVEIFEKCFRTEYLNFYGKNKKVYITNDFDYTHAIIINTAMPELLISRENVIGMAWEHRCFLQITPNFIEYAKKNIGKYFISDAVGLPAPFIDNYSYCLYSYPKKEIEFKTEMMSLVLNDTCPSIGCMYREKLVEIIVKNNLPIDIFTCVQLSPSFEKTNKIRKMNYSTEPYENYAFTISIEKFKSNHYMTDIVITPLLCDCVPIYFGCNMIDKYVGENQVVKMTGKLLDDMEIIKDVLCNPNKYYKETDKEQVEKGVNLLRNLDDVLAPYIIVEEKTI